MAARLSKATNPAVATCPETWAIRPDPYRPSLGAGRDRRVCRLAQSRCHYFRQYRSNKSLPYTYARRWSSFVLRHRGSKRAPFERIHTRSEFPYWPRLRAHANDLRDLERPDSLEVSVI